jgi:CubicO group peptidase (beta-lactamase class C family)
VRPRGALLLLLFACGTSPLDGAFASAASIPNVRSLRVVQNGQIVREKYWNGTDATTPHDVRSVTKSVTSLLVGIAAQQGCLSLDATLGQTLGAPEAPTDPTKAAITARQLLEMSGGFQWNELGNVDEYNNWVLSPDPVQYVLARPLVDAPGTYFSYNSAEFFLLSVMLTNGCGDTLTFAQKNLFTPLGIAPPQWEQFDAPPEVNGGAGLQLSTDDLTKIGELVLAKGLQIVPADYVTAATTVQISNGDASDFGGGYGYGFWIGVSGTHTFAMAQGYGGQFIFVEPDDRVVVVATSDWQGQSATAEQTFDSLYALISKQIIPTLTASR